jgi:putative ABC transport system substrate-binding protein
MMIKMTTFVKPVTSRARMWRLSIAGRRTNTTNCPTSQCRQVTVIAAHDTPSSIVAKAATTTIPIVYTGGADPVKLGLVASLNQPGGNATGVSFFTAETGSKQAGLVHELIPAAAHVGLLVNPNFPATDA